MWIYITKLGNFADFFKFFQLCGKSLTSDLLNIKSSLALHLITMMNSLVTGLPTPFLAVQLYVSEWLSFTFSKLNADLDSSIVVCTAFSPFLLHVRTGAGFPWVKHWTVSESPSFNVITSVFGILVIEGGTKTWTKR